jgi:flagellar basal-body rod protein FlgB
MLNLTETSGIGLIKLALDASAMRHQTIANNIANANTPGYIPLKVNFEEQFSRMRSQFSDGGFAPVEDFSDIQPIVEPDAANAGGETSSVALDNEVANLTQNVIHYQALMKGLSKKFSILSAAINEGKR